MDTEGRNRREEPRISLRRPGELRSGTTIIPCVLQDLSSKGFRIQTEQKYSVGEVLVFVCELAPAKTLHCKVEVRHVFEACIGTKILEISSAAAALLDGFLKDLYAGRGARDELDFTK
jgi:hypothetical protein